MENVEDHAPPAGLLTGGNAQSLIGDSSRRVPNVNRAGVEIPRIPTRDTPDASAIGFEKILARFDEFELRLGKLETRRNPDPDPLYNSDDPDVDDFRFQRDDVPADDEIPWTFNHGGRDRGGDVRRRRGALREQLNRRGRSRQFNHDDAPYRVRQETPQRTNWDRPAERYPRDRDRGFRGYRHPTAWDPPVDRYDHTGARNERGKELSMKPPRFDGSDATNWISRVEYYFDHLRMPESERLHYVVMLFQPPAAEWIFNYRDNNPMVSWREFLEDVRHRFAPQSFRNSIGPLSKLVQTGSITEYHDAFERHLNRVKGLSDEALIPIFITGLKDPIQEKVELQEPESLAEAMALALRLGTSHEERSRQTNRGKWPARDSRYPSVAGASAAAQPDLPGKEPAKTAFKPIRVSNAEKAERSRKGLCYHCPEKWAPGHVCKHKMLSYVGEDDVDPRIDEPESGEEMETIITADLSHLHALAGGPKGRPFNVVGSIAHTSVSILIDTGSTHDFLHPRVANKLQLALSPIRPFRVYVGNGASLVCSHIARRTKLCIQGIDFLIDLHIMEIHGPDIVLGMEWLESLGKISADFVGKTLEFTRDGARLSLRGVLPSPRLISLQSLSVLTAHSSTHEFYELIQIEPEDGGIGGESEAEFPQEIPVEVRRVLEGFRPVFSVPTGMPPCREFDHRIHLLPNTKPINVRPYRYPYFQKNEIERQVRDMLEQGIIQRSHSPFSSPVLLIRKKDGTFRFCIDYRALNSATVPDHFPIPTADELFDELGKAKFFTKLDLRSGYHQIRMHDADVFKTAFRTHDGHFEFLVMPFGLTNAPSTFQAVMNSIFQPLL